MIQGGFGAGGAEKVMARLACHRAEYGDEVHIAGMTIPAGGSFFPYPRSVSLHVLTPNATRNAMLQPRRILAIRRLIRSLHPDIIISFLTKVNCLTLLAIRGMKMPVIISERNNPSLQSAGGWNNLQRMLLPYAAGLVMQTEDAADTLPSVQRLRARIIPNPCQPVFFRQTLDSPVCRFVGVGRLDQQKGFDMLIDAFSMLPPDLPAQLEIFGQGQEQYALSRRIEQSGQGHRIRLAGVAASPREWLSAGDAVVISSRYEGFSNVLAEATCSGLPAIAFDCHYGIRDMLVDGQNGLLVADGDVAALAAAIERFALDQKLRARLGQAPHLMAGQLNPTRIMAQWDQLIDDVLAAGQIPACEDLNF
ncbi:MAG: glycosyltransferase [Paracoccus sp. (in: a-proteobacteria)]